MAEEQQKTVTLDGVTHNLSDLTEQQVRLVVLLLKAQEESSVLRDKLALQEIAAQQLLTALRTELGSKETEE